MALMSGLAVVATPPTIEERVAPWPYYESRRVGFRDLNGNDLLTWDTSVKAFVIKQGLTGFDLPPRDLVRSKIAGIAGSRLREVRVNEREVFVPMFVAGGGHSDFLSRRDEVADMLSEVGVDYQTNGGTFDLVASSERSTRTLRCMYESGLEGDFSADAMGNWWESFGLVLLAVQPYWQDGEWSTPTVRLPDAEAWFPDFPGVLSPSRVLGADMPVLVGGDAPSWPTVDVTGPATSVTITSAAAGLTVTVPDGLASGEFFRLTTDPRIKRVASFDGVTDWTRVGPDDAYGNGMPPGVVDVSITVPGATSATSARVYGPALYQRAW